MNVNELVFQINDGSTEYDWLLLIILGLAFKFLKLVELDLLIALDH